ncbi:flagellar export chaperone FlgN [Roseibium polysiphoniae]|nr:flagellar export chaperone FlgN [Roseibium polysiphoniae]
MTTRSEKQPNVVLSPKDIAKVEAIVDHAICVADDLIAVTEEENRRLTSGRPTSIEDLLERKQKLAAELELFLKKFRAQSNIFLLASPAKFTELQHRNEKLTTALAHNNQNLVRALTANRRRVKTIMRAIQDKQQSTARYGVNGQYNQNTPHPVSIGRRYEA